jgi:hypothetical protein
MQPKECKADAQSRQEVSDSNRAFNWVVSQPVQLTRKLALFSTRRAEYTNRWAASASAERIATRVARSLLTSEFNRASRLRME